jgi:hypothetical protein
VSDVAAIDTDVTAVAAIDSDVTAVAGVASDIPTVADNVSNINDYANTYQGAKATAPTLRNNGGALLEGDMYFNTTSDTMFVYGSGGWVPAGSSVNGTSQRYRYIATSGQTTFTGADSNGNTLTYDAGFADIYLNGVRLDSTDFTATTGTSIVLASGAALNDELNIVAFGTFNVASFNGSGLDDNTVNISKLNATGTRDGTTFLAGDNTFKTVAVTPTAISDQANTSTGYMMMPVGTTAQRPGTPAAGMYRMNSTNGNPEWYDSASANWIPFANNAPYPIEFLVVAGGGGAGGRVGGGGGAGGLIYYGAETPKTPNGSAQTVLAGTSYSVVVGAGGTGGFGGIDGTESSGTQGSSSQFGAYTAAVGGGLGRDGNNNQGGSGGSGGGPGYGSVGTSPVGVGTSGQGNNSGASSDLGSAYPYLKGGGGGAGAVGGSANISTGVAGSGGIGLQYSISGSATYFAGGGGGGTHNPANGSGSGGLGGGGAAGASGGKNAGVNGTSNTGGGGGGASTDNASSYKGGNGGSGVVVIRYLGGQKGSGGTVTSAGGYTIHTFTSSGTFTA